MENTTPMIDRDEFVGYMTLENIKGGKRYVPALPDGRIFVYDGADGIDLWLPAQDILNDRTLRPKVSRWKRSARRTAWARYWNESNLKQPLRFV